MKKLPRIIAHGRMVSDFWIFLQRVELVAAESFTAVLKGRKRKQMKIGMKLCS